MQLKEILSIEENRTEDSRAVIHLFQEGSFYRAYEWSAWLCHRFINQFKVTHRHFKSIEPSVLFVGFPVTSLPKYVAEGAMVYEIDEKSKDLVLTENVIPHDMTLDVMAAEVRKESVTTWQECVDMDFVFYLTREIIMLNPIDDCRMKGRKEDWADLPHNKSLFNSDEGCGLPIGNLTSQLFSNVYLGELDDFMKRELHCKHYGRYVDDFYVVSADKEWLISLISVVKAFLSSHLGLTLHDGKLKILNVRQGVEFLGAFLKPWRKYVANCCLHRMKLKIMRLNQSVKDFEPSKRYETFLMLRSSLNSFLGVLSHYKSKALRTNLMYSMPCFFYYGCFDANVLVYENSLPELINFL